MLTGRAFFADCDEGMIWCDSCVPAKVVCLATEDLPSERFKPVESGELVIRWTQAQGWRPKRLRARCHICGAIQPKP